MTLDMSAVKIINVTRPIQPLKAPVSVDDISLAVRQEAMIWPLEEFGNYIDDSIAQIIRMKSHLKTHTESPYHLNHAGKPLNEFPIGTFIGRMVNMHFKDVDVGFHIDAEYFARLDNGRIKEGDIVIIHADLDESVVPTGLEASVQLPYITPDVGRYLIDRKIKLFGADCSMDFGFFVNGERAHDLMLKAGIPILEMLTNLDQLTQDVAFMVAVPGVWAVEGVDSSTTPAAVLEGFEVV